MESQIMRLLTQPSVAFATSSLAMVGVAVVLLGSAHVPTVMSIALMLALAVAVVLAYRYPIYMRHNTKLCVYSFSLFLMAVLLNPFLAGVGVALSVLGGEWMVQRQRGTQVSDILTQAARWTMLGVLASLIAHLSFGAHNSVIFDVQCALAGALLWIGDLLTLPFVLTPITRERPLRIISTAFDEGGFAEVGQYVVGMVGVLLAQQQVWAVSLLAMPAVLIYLAFKKDVDANTLQLLETMADSVDLRNPYGAGHSKRVTDLVHGVLNELGMHGQEAAQILTASRLHEIGRMGLPDAILYKTNSLTSEEQKVIETCPDRAVELLEGYPDLSRCASMIRHQHERWDGKGYPHRLAGTDIPFGARLIAIADAFDAMTSERPYRPALNTEQALRILQDGAGRQWDPALVCAFLTSLGHQAQQQQTVPVNTPADAAVAVGERMPA